MLLSDFSQGKLLSHSQRYEAGSIRICTSVMHRVVDKLTAINSHCDGLALPSEIEAEFFLALDQCNKNVFCDSAVGSCESDGIWSDSLCFLVTDEFAPIGVETFICCGEEVIENRLLSFVCAKLSCK